MAGLTACEDDPAPTSSTDGSPQSSRDVTGPTTTTAGQRVSTTTTATTAGRRGSTTTKKPSTTVAIVANNTTTVLPPPPPPPSPTKRRENGGSFVQTVTTMEVKVYKYDDELMKKLIWISAMTVVGIAMVFVVMFVVFFNCASRAPDGAKRQRPQPTTGAAKVHGKGANGKRPFEPSGAPRGSNHGNGGTSSNNFSPYLLC